MTMNESWGYNPSDTDYKSARSLIHMLCEVTGRGGNLLLNVGPTADGRIPVEMQDRLAYLGQWLAHNGEAIHGTRVFRDGAQWTAGRKQEVDTSTNYRAKYDVEALTLTPAPGDARKELLFTRKDRTLYAIVPLYPKGELTVREIRLATGARIALLGTRHANLPWRQKGTDVVISTPQLSDGEVPFAGAFAFRLEGLVER